MSNLFLDELPSGAPVQTPNAGTVTLGRLSAFWIAPYLKPIVFLLKFRFVFLRNLVIVTGNVRNNICTENASLQLV